MELTGLHLLLTYQCNFECDHCFVWGSPWQEGVMTLPAIRRILAQAQDLGTIRRIYFEGGEPFLYYAVLLKGAQEAAAMGFQVGIVSNGYWANDVQDAVETLRPFAGIVQDLSISTDLFHYSEKLSQQAQNARAAAERLEMPMGLMSVAKPEATDVTTGVGQLPIGESAVMYRGRAVETLAPMAAGLPWDTFAECPHEDLREPGRLHLDPYGNLHLCQGISAGNLFQTPLAELCAAYDPDAHPIAGPLLAGGPAELVRRYALPHEATYADACHLCDQARRSLRARFPEALLPDQMYGVATNG
jgi:hypothetical protein